MKRKKKRGSRVGPGPTTQTLAQPETLTQRTHPGASLLFRASAAREGEAAPPLVGPRPPRSPCPSLSSPPSTLWTPARATRAVPSSAPSLDPASARSPHSPRLLAALLRTPPRARAPSCTRAHGAARLRCPATGSSPTPRDSRPSSSSPRSLDSGRPSAPAPERRMPAPPSPLLHSQSAAGARPSPCSPLPSLFCPRRR